MRVALYARVSTEEQKKHGISIDAQLEALRAWAKQNKHDIVGEYVDAGISGKKPYTKRPELSRFMNEIENGLQVDALIMTKLDRFYRSVRLYYQAIDIMERHNVAWKAIHEDYETVTASGRFKVNIMLAVAEDEADRTSERIRTVFEYKAEKGEVLSGSIPLGYRVEDKRLVLDDNADLIRAAFDHYAQTGSLHAVMDFLRSNGINLHANSVGRMMKNEIYKGKHRGNPNFAPAIVPPELFDEIQRQIKSRSVRKNPTGRIYLFSGLIRCGRCGKAMAGITNNGKYPSYRCTNASMNHKCTNNHYINEAKLEAAIVPVVTSAFENYVAEYTLHKKERDTSQERTQLRKRLDRLKEVYLDGLLTKERYRAEYGAITKRLDELTEAPEPNFQKTRQILKSDIEKIYPTLTRAEKRTFWRSILERIVVDEEVELYFR